MNSTTRREHIDYLRQTLIPDLVESGHLATAVDFETCCRFLDQVPIGQLNDVTQPEESEMLAYINEWRGRA